MSDLTMGNKKIFLMDVDPFAHRTPDATVDEFIYEHELEERTSKLQHLIDAIDVEFRKP
ncbi:hypothetical protein [Salmonella enterica]|uniref:hypothetical protein n=1 Tax=Salmonella enterica TaxID=28901 RepID=UPI0016001E45|nr:hypothetical protein [Salmonella enterica]